MPATTVAPPAGQKVTGLDDSFVLDGQGGILSNLTGEQLVRATDPSGAVVPPGLHLRCGFFTVPTMERWFIGQLDLKRSNRSRLALRTPRPGIPARQLTVERYGGARKFVFLPEGATAIEGLPRWSIDLGRQWIRPVTPSDIDYRVAYQGAPTLTTGRAAANDARDLLLLPESMDRDRFAQLMRKWRVGERPIDAMNAIANGLARHCRYDRAEPVGPFRYPIENFLFADGDRHGYCMYFATAAALMLRLRGIPCRIGVGLYGGDLERGERSRLFGSHHAHAWVEVPLENHGYVVFDPTPPDARGQRFVLDRRAVQPSSAPAESATPTSKPLLRRVLDAIGQPWTWAALVLAALVMAAWPRPQPSPPKQSEPPVIRSARRLLQRILRALAEAGHVRRHGQTLEQFAAELASQGQLTNELAQGFRSYQEVRFGRRPFDQHRTEHLASALRSALTLRDQPAEAADK